MWLSPGFKTSSEGGLQGNSNSNNISVSTSSPLSPVLLHHLATLVPYHLVNFQVNISVTIFALIVFDCWLNTSVAMFLEGRTWYAISWPFGVQVILAIPVRSHLGSRPSWISISDAIWAQCIRIHLGSRCQSGVHIHGRLDQILR